MLKSTFVFCLQKSISTSDLHSLCIQGNISFYEAKKDFVKKRIPPGTSNPPSSGFFYRRDRRDPRGLQFGSKALREFLERTVRKEVLIKDSFVSKLPLQFLASSRKVSPHYPSSICSANSLTELFNILFSTISYPSSLFGYETYDLQNLAELQSLTLCGNIPIKMSRDTPIQEDALYRMCGYLAQVLTDLHIRAVFPDQPFLETPEWLSVERKDLDTNLVQFTLTPSLLSEGNLK